MLTKVRQTVLPKIEALGAIEASIIDDTGFPKKGKHSVGVARQYCGQLGKQDNCQVVVSLSVANHHASLPIAHRLYLPETWANDVPRRKKAKVPVDVVFQTKPQIALDQLKAAKTAGIPLGTVLTDAAYGNDSKFRDGVTELGLLYVVGVQSNMLLWKADSRSAVAKAGPEATVASPTAPLPSVSQGTGPRPARRGLADDHLARGRRGVHLALRASARSSGHPGRATRRGVAADRMARGRG